MKNHRNPEIILGALLTIAIFAMGAAIASSLHASLSQAGFAEWTMIVLTAAMVLSTAGQWIETRRAAHTASRAFSDMERPYIYVFGVRDIVFEEDHPDDSYSRIAFSAANYGKTPAAIESVYIGINVGETPDAPKDITWHALRGSPILTPNERRDKLYGILPSAIPIQQYADEHTPPDNSQMEPILKENEQFYFWVKIRYSGPFSGPHETNARWRWDQVSARLIKYDRDEYN
jgi:hypothetical protein